MHNLSDQELDRLSKEAAEKYEAAASPALWDKLRQRLEAEMPEKKKDKRGFFWLYGLAGLMLCSLTVGITVMINTEYKFKPGSIGSGLTKNDIQDKKNLTEKVVLGKPDFKLKEQPAFENQAVENPQKQSLSNSKTAGKASKKRQENPLPVYRSLNRNSDQIDFKRNKNVASTSSFIDQPVIEPNKIFVNTIPDPAGQTEKDKQSSNAIAVSKQKDRLVTKPDSTAVTAATGAVIAEKEKSDSAVSALSAGSKNKIQPQKRLEVSAVFGPDFSNVGFETPDKTGINIGLTVGYRFTERLSVQTGLIYSEKHYTAVDDAYKVFPGYNMSNPNFKMTYVQANCFMWDLPINLRYDWLLRKKQRAFISAGLSNYFMNKEDLHYYYTYNNNPRYKAWVNNENSSYWLAAVNLSVGYEYRISRLFSIQAEPYIKIPTGQIGYGKINLNTLGMFLSIKYSPAPFLFKHKKNRNQYE